ncbi:hypothetical protein Tco_0056636, partial [Tanacetum coccineum]
MISTFSALRKVHTRTLFVLSSSNRGILLKKKLMQKETVSKQGRKPAKYEPTVHKDPAFDDFDDIVDDAMDYIETKDAQDEERTSSKTLELSLSGDTVVLEKKESAEKGVSTEDPVITAQPKVSTDKPKVSTDNMETEDAQDVGRTRYVVHEEKESAEKGVSTEDALSTAQPKVSTEKEKVSTDKPKVSTDNIETEDAQDMGRTRNVVHEEKESTANGVSTEDAL